MQSRAFSDYIPIFFEEIVMRSLTNTNEAYSILTCPNMTITYMPCYNYSIKLSNWICKV